jgi:hypothetical protein
MGPLRPPRRRIVEQVNQAKRVRAVLAAVCSQGSAKENWQPGDVGVACLTMFFGMSLNLRVEPRLVKEMLDKFYSEYVKEFPGSTEGTS